MRSYCIRHRQRAVKGEVLFESIIAMLVVGILAGGPAYLMASASAMGAYSDIQIQAIGQMRDLLAVQGQSLCTTPVPPAIVIQGRARSLTVSCTGAVAVTIAHISVQSSAPTISLSLTDDNLLGGQTLVVQE